MKAFYLRIFCPSFALLLFCIFAAAQDKVWRPVTPEELQLKTPRIEADADAEVLFWDVRIVDGFDGRMFNSTLNNYVRIKIFTTRGRDEHNKIDIPFGTSLDTGANITLKEIFARTIKPDGTILEVKPTDMFEQETVKAQGVKVKSKSFVMPGVEVGSIIEYRWREIREDALSMFIRLELAHEIPVESVKYSIKPVPIVEYGLRLHSFNTPVGFTLGKDGYYTTSMENIASFKEEAFMPAAYEIRPWVLVYYDNNDEKGTAEQYWRVRGKETYKYHDPLMAYNKDIDRATKEVVGDATDPMEQVRRVFEFCRKTIVNVNDDASGLTPEQLKNYKPGKNVNDVLTRRMGTRHDILMLFGSMLTSMAVDVRVANVPLRTDPKFQKRIGNRFFNRSEIIAAKIGDDWKFFDPSNKYVPFGSLQWSEEGQQALISDSNEPFFVQTQVSAPDKSCQTRTANLHLNDDGSVEGDVRIEYTGHIGRYFKELNDDWSAAEREKSLISRIKRMTMDAVELSAISIENVTDTEKPFTYTFHIRLPSYAQKTGKRLFLKPNIFERSSNAIFSKSDRRYDIWFDYNWSENDNIEIEYPRGYTPESLESPSRVSDSYGNVSLDTNYELAGDRPVLKYKRKFVFGTKSILEYDQGDYPDIKRLFDSIYTADSQGIMLLKNTP